MSIFRQKYKDRSGKPRESKCWYFDVTDHLETRRRFKGLADKRLTEGWKREIERLVEYRKSNESPRADSLRWIESAGKEMQARLLGLGLIDAADHARGMPLATLLDDFRSALSARDSTEEHVNLVVWRARAVIDGCGFVFFSDVNSEKVERYLADRRNSKLDSIGRQTSNFYLASLKQFCGWMVKSGRTPSNPLAGADRLNVAEDVRRERRELSEAELRKLLDATLAGPARLGVPALQRYRIYRVAVATGLRASEIASLTPRSFDLDSAVPTITVDAKASKRRSRDTLPIPHIADEVAEWIAGMAPTARLFPGPWAKHKYGGRFIRADLKAAGVEQTDDQGRVADFHALRHTCLSQLGRSGASPKVMQLYARHSTVELTIGRYGHASLSDMAGAARMLPDLSPTRQTQPEALRATGTDARDDHPDGRLSFTDASTGGTHRGSQLCTNLPDVLPMSGDLGGAAHESRTRKEPEKQRKPTNSRRPSSGEGEIRTRGTRKGTPVFETGTIGHSVTSPVHSAVSRESR